MSPKPQFIRCSHTTAAGKPCRAWAMRTPSPDGPTPDGPTPDGPTPDGPTPDGPTPDGLSPDGPTPHGQPPACRVHSGRTSNPEVPPEQVEVAPPEQVEGAPPEQVEGAPPEQVKGARPEQVGGGQNPGPPRHNQNARRYGFYASALDPQELADLIAYADDLSLDDEIACARAALRRLLVLLDVSDVSQFDDPADAQPMTRADYARLMGLALQAARTIARLLRDKRALSGAAADGITGAIGTALDELTSLWGVSL